MMPGSTMPSSIATLDEHDDDELRAYRRLAAWREFNTMLRYWIACPNRRCRRARRCCGDVESCHALFWPVVPEEFKVWWRAICEARRDKSSQRQALRAASAAVASWRKRKAVRLADAAAVQRRSAQALERPKQEARPVMPAPHSPPSPTPPSPRMRSV